MVKEKMGKKVKEKDALIQGKKVSEFVFSSLMELFSVRSERVICAFRDFLSGDIQRKRYVKCLGLLIRRGIA